MASKEMSSSEFNFPELVGRYKVLEKVGEGTFATVYKGLVFGGDPHTPYVALKRIQPTSSPARVAKEIEMLLKLGGANYVSPILQVLRKSHFITLVMPYLEHNSFKDCFLEMDELEVRDYIRALFQALAHVHANGVCHRDVKPTNFLYNRVERKYMLIDFGLAQKIDHYGYCISGEEEGSSPSSSNTNLSNNNNNNSNNNNNNNNNDNTTSMFDISGKSKKSKRQRTDGLPISPFSLTAPPLQTLDKPFLPPIDFTFPLSHAVTTPQLSSHNSHITFSPQTSPSHTTFPGNVLTVPPIPSLSKPVASRAGTRGFRPPEVLMKYHKQTTAIDIWSVGVILLSILSGRYPFFCSPDDLTGLAEIMAICGTENLEACAISLGKRLQTSQRIPPIDWKELCLKLRAASGLPSDFSDELYDLLKRCLDLNPSTRITASNALFHPVFLY